MTNTPEYITLGLKPIHENAARDLFPNWAIYWLDEKERIVHRAWWTQIGGRFHQFPAGKEHYFVTAQAPLSLTKVSDIYP